MINYVMQVVFSSQVYYKMEYGVRNDKQRGAEW